MSSDWKRGPTHTECSKHAEAWPNDAAETCPQCSPADAALRDDEAPGEHEAAAIAAIENGAPTLEEYERAFRSTGRLARRWAKAAYAVGEFGSAARLLGENVKADRAAYEIARDRADKAWVEKRSKDRLRRARGFARPSVEPSAAESIN